MTPTIPEKTYSADYEYVKEWRKRNPEKLRASQRRYAEKHPEVRATNIKLFKERHPERVVEYGKQYRAENSVSIAAAKKEWYIKNREATHKRALNRLHERLLTDSSFAKKYTLKLNMACSINQSLKGNKNGRSWEKLVGYTLDDLIRHLERHFLPGMTWQNRGRGGWHIDHKNPVSAFNFETTDDLDFQKCWNLKNLRPLWEPDNLKKSDRIESPFQPSLAMGG